jgi:hypothetical protein
MRKLASVLLAGLLGACANGISATQIAQDIQIAQSVAQQVCNVIPDAASIAAIISAGNPLVATGTAIGEAICAAIKNAGITPPATMSMRAVRMGGVIRRLPHWTPPPVVLNGVTVNFL